MSATRPTGVPPARGVSKPRKMAEVLARTIVDEIVDGDLAIGTPLLSEREMLQKYGVARATLREALRFLEMQRVIEIKTGAGGGPVVADPGSRPLASAIALLLQLSRTSFRSIIDARLALEPMLAAKAAVRRSDEQLATLKRTLAVMRAELEGEARFLEQNVIFHTTIALAAGNPVLFHMISSLTWIEDGTAIGIDYARETFRPIVAAHRRIYVAIEQRDATMAEAAMRLHVGEFAAYAERHYGRVLGRPIPWSQVDA